MSCIDKTYVSSWEEWKELKDWVWDKKIELKNGLTCYPRNCMYYPDYDEKQVNEWLENVRQSNMKMYGYTYDVAVERSEIPFWNTPTYVDIWLIKLLWRVISSAFLMTMRRAFLYMTVLIPL